MSNVFSAGGKFFWSHVIHIKAPLFFISEATMQETKPPVAAACAASMLRNSCTAAREKIYWEKHHG